VVGVIDPEESEATQKLRANVHSIRVRLIRAASRLGYAHDNGLVKQVQWLDQLNCTAALVACVGYCHAVSVCLERMCYLMARVCVLATAASTVKGSVKSNQQQQQQQQLHAAAP
jgi:hypothetical protein